MKTRLIALLQRLMCGIPPVKLTIRIPDDNGCEYCALVKAEDGRPALADPHNPFEINPQVLIVESLPEEVIYRICAEVLSTKLAIFTELYPEFNHIDKISGWAQDAYNVLNDAFAFMLIEHIYYENKPVNEQKKRPYARHKKGS